jgi:hypothetical protein
MFTQNCRYQLHLNKATGVRPVSLSALSAHKPAGRRQRMGHRIMAAGESSTAAAPETSRSSKPAIFGVTEADEEITFIASEEDLHALENIGSELNTAISQLVVAERDLFNLVSAGAETDTLRRKQTERAEASSQLERRVGWRGAVVDA